MNIELSYLQDQNSLYLQNGESIQNNNFFEDSFSFSFLQQEWNHQANNQHQRFEAQSEQFYIPEQANSSFSNEILIESDNAHRSYEPADCHEQSQANLQKGIKTNSVSEGKNVFGAVVKACKTMHKKKQPNLYQLLRKKQAFVEKNFILPQSSRAHIISYPSITYYFVKNELPQENYEQMTKDLVRELIANRQSYNRRNQNKRTQNVQGNIRMNQKIILFLQELLLDIKRIENIKWIKERVVEICFKTRTGKNSNKQSCRQQIQNLYENITNKIYKGIFEAQRNELNIAY